MPYLKTQQVNFLGILSEWGPDPLRPLPNFYLSEESNRLSDKVSLLLHVGKHQNGKLMGLSGNVLVKSNISKSKFDVFDIREDFSLNIQNMRKIHLLGFSIQRLWEKSLEISRNFSIGLLFSK